MEGTSKYLIWRGPNQRRKMNQLPLQPQLHTFINSFDHVSPSGLIHYESRGLKQPSLRHKWVDHHGTMCGLWCKRACVDARTHTHTHNPDPWLSLSTYNQTLHMRCVNWLSCSDSYLPEGSNAQVMRSWAKRGFALLLWYTLTRIHSHTRRKL